MDKSSIAVAAEAGVQAGASAVWGFREWLSFAGVVTLVGMIFRAGQVYRDHRQVVDGVQKLLDHQEVHGQQLATLQRDSEDLRKRFEAMAVSSKENGERRDAERDAMRKELKDDIRAVHGRVDELLQRAVR